MHTYLGHIVGSGLVRPEPAKIQAVKDFPVPQTKKQVRIFLGLAGYYRRFIPDYSSISAPLTDLTRKVAPNQVLWSAKCDQAFHISNSYVHHLHYGALILANLLLSKQMYLTVELVQSSVS